jgi:hypothetical protein
MRSPADRVRLERLVRAIALVSLALWIANAAWPRSDRAAVIRGPSLGDALPRLTTAEPADSIHALLDTVPDARTAAWLAALRGAGLGVSWSGATGAAMALETFRSADPAAGIVLLAATPSATSVIGDALGPIDTIAGALAPATLRLASAEGDVTLRAGQQPARVNVAPAATTRRVYVAGSAGWEAKFVIAALEEAGWSVDARLFVRPDHDVVQGGGARTSLDTARYAVVVLMDSAAAETTRGVEEFVRAGGGVVLAGDASRARRVTGLVAWRAARREIAPLGTLPGDTAWRGLSRFELDTIPARRAIALALRGDNMVVAARRHYAGRVVAVGYDQTWRWRMAGGENGVAEHRAWWSRVVAGVAPTVILSASNVIPSEARDLQLRTGAAPLASLYDVIGPPSTASTTLGSRLPFALLSNLLGALALAALLAEWLLRRSRGAR